MENSLKTFLGTLGIDTAGVLDSPNLGQQARINEVDDFPGVSDANTIDDMFIGVDPTIPAAPDPSDDLVSVLKRIEANTRGREGKRQIRPHYERLVGIADGERQYRVGEGFANVFISVDPLLTESGAVLDIFAGAGTSLFLARLAPGQSRNIELPYDERVITVRWTLTGGTGDVAFNIIFATNKFAVS